MKKYKLVNVFIILLMIFNLILPKAGTKVAEMPLYVGNTLAFILAPFIFAEIIKNSNKNKEKIFLIITFLLLLLNVLLPLLVLPDLKIDLVKTLMVLSAICIYPLMYFIPKYYNDINYLLIYKIAFLILILYGFLQKLFGEYNVVIPGLTVNYYDWFSQPNFFAAHYNYISGIDFLKMTSTYQNGNLLGLNLHLIFWVAFLNFKRKKLMFLLYSLAILLTASASSYFAFFIIFIFYFLINSFKKGKINFGFIFLLISSLVITLIIVFSNNYLSSILSERLFDRDLSSAGGRLSKLTEGYLPFLQSHSWLRYFIGSGLDGITGNEMVLIGTFQSFGLLGMFLLAFRLILFIGKPKIDISYFAIYAFLLNSLIDSGLTAPPTYFNFFITLGVIKYSIDKKRGDSYESFN